jgi:hypothetical protein
MLSGSSGLSPVKCFNERHRVRALPIALALAGVVLIVVWEVSHVRDEARGDRRQPQASRIIGL